MKYYTDVSGNYLGALDHINIGLGGFVEVSDPEASPPDVWYNGQFIPALTYAKYDRLFKLKAEYEAAISVSVTYTTVGGIEKVYQADEISRYNVIAMNLAYKDGTPEGFYWKSEDNTKVTPFTNVDLTGLAKTIGDQGFAAFNKADGLKTAILMCTTIEEVQAIIW